MKKVLFATLGMLGVIGVTAGVLLTHKSVPKKETKPQGEVQGTNTQAPTAPVIASPEDNQIPGDFPSVNPVTPTDDAPTQPTTDGNLEMSLENTTKELDAMMPALNDMKDVQ